MGTKEIWAKTKIFWAHTNNFEIDILTAEFCSKRFGSLGTKCSSLRSFCNFDDLTYVKSILNCLKFCGFVS